MERSVWITVAAIGLVCAILYGGKLHAIESDRARLCRQWAEVAVDIHRNLKAGVIVNVFPHMEAFKQMVADFKGTEKELGEFVISDCMGVRT